MIKFFRRIRQKLLSENKFSKYLFYAIGEIILVVIGILIALQINNWNENRKELKHQNFLFAQLLSDAKADSVFFEDRLSGIAILDSTLRVALQLGKDSSFDISKINTNGMGRLFPMSGFRHNSNLLDNNLDIYQDLLDFEIKGLVRKYKSTYSYLKSSFYNLNSAIDEIWLHSSKKYYREFRQNRDNQSIDALKTIYSDATLQSSIDDLMRRCRFAEMRTNELLQVNQELRELLQIKLKRND